MSDTSLLNSSPSNYKKGSTLTTNLLFAIFVTCLGPIQFGYHIAELNAPQQVMSCDDTATHPNSETGSLDTHGLGWLENHGLKQCIPMTDQQIGIVTAMFSIGGLIGSYYAGSLAERYGRKRVNLINNFCFALFGSLCMFTANNVIMLILGRVLVGIAAGVSIVVTSLYINDIAPVEWRGALGTMNQLSINLGILLTQTVALKYADVHSWRWIFFVGAFVALSNFVLWFKIEESPRWLLGHRDQTSAEKALYKLRNATYQEVKQELQSWQRSIDSETDQEAHNSNINNNIHTKKLTLLQYVKSSEFKKPREAISTILIGQQFCGINSIIFYGVRLVSELLPNQAVIINLGLSILNVIFTFISSSVIERFGRKPLLISSASAMSMMSFIIMISIMGEHAKLLVTSIYFYIIAFALGVGPIPFLIIGELSQDGNESKAMAQSYGTVCNWLATFVVGYGFPVLSKYIDGYVYLIFAIFAAWFAWHIKKAIPETKGKTDYNSVWNGY
ncbi:Vvs1p NDAI_0F02060 [Naumovozyma dairenensis CBS 421]|uniref:Major facilitator superfamily (MFS) profile domain-containing protein n=1 Tax=Naumovozyma dairenensis (strain ATCC 10597 / BCRC 20456 / CBS 421 / NBRC 0211 / NRRL Y-12639) TaxID=1071378 RepID=G0WCL3_NAUDC|nr:hypothetical protein NDAI_0F02060 [Naumovozyma dairenensis CBS 421]CCD25524.1 hypothetical protein NDAI_0F02060 [Naumovozyma dairenensis CBS 421]